MAPYTLLKRFSASLISSQPSFRKPAGRVPVAVSSDFDLCLVEVFEFFFFFLKRGRLALLHFGLPALEEVEGVRGFGVDVLDHRENVQDVLLCEGGLVAAVEVVLFNQDLEGQKQCNTDLSTDLPALKSLLKTSRPYT